MERIIKKSVFIPIPIIGIPIKNLYTPYAIMPSNIGCDLHIKISEKNSTKDGQIKKATYGSEAIFDYVNELLNELGYGIIGGSFLIKCTEDPPFIAVLAITSMEILKSILNIKHSDYTLMLDALTLFDEKKLHLDPGYTKALRCAYIYNTMCIARGYDDLIKLSSRKLMIKKLSEVVCPGICSAVDNPYDANTLSLFYKLSTHVIGLLAQAVRELDEEKLRSLRRFLDLYMVLESSIVKEYIGSEDLALSYGVKPVVDYNSIKFYKVIALA